MESFERGGGVQEPELSRREFPNFEFDLSDRELGFAEGCVDTNSFERGSFG